MNISGGYFKLNDEFCLDPAYVIAECRRKNISTTEWENKVNSFTMRNGVDPSEGYVLCNYDALAASEAGLTIGVLDYSTVSGGVSAYQGSTTPLPRTTKIFSSLRMSMHKRITPSAVVGNGVAIVKLTDARYALSQSVVGKQFNIVTALDTTTPPYTYEYDDTTATSSSVAYTWAEIFQEVWNIPGGTVTLSVASIDTADWPDYTPQGIDFRYTTRRDALQKLLEWCNFTIVHSGSNFSLEVASANSAAITTLTTNLSPFLVKETRTTLLQEEHPRPNSYTYHKRKLTPDTYEYDTSSAASSGSPANVAELSVWLPHYSTDGISDTNFNDEDKAATITTHFTGVAGDYYDRFQPTVAEYAGLHELSQVPYIDEVRWTLGARGQRTKITSVVNNRWNILPESLDSADPAQFIYARVNEPSDVAADTSLYDFDGGTTIYGCVVAPTTGEFRNDGSARADNDPLLLYRLTSTDEWTPVPTGAGGSTQIQLFRLTADLSIADDYTTAKPVDTAGDVIAAAATVRVLNFGNRWHGFGPYTDGNAGAASHPGSLVAARFVTDNHESSGLQGWAIVDCEGWAETLVVQLYQNVASGVAGADILSPGDFGLEATGRYPRIEGDTYDITVNDTLDGNPGEDGTTDQRWLVRYDVNNDEYVLVREFEWLIIAGECTTTVATTDTTFTINSLDVVAGYKTTGTTITVQNELLQEKGSGNSFAFNNTEVVLVVWDKRDRKWRLLFSPDYGVIKGSADSTVTTATTTFTISSIEVVQGRKPSTTSVTVTNDPVGEFANTSEVFARWDKAEKKWVTADAGNFAGLEKGWLKSQTAWTASGTIVFGASSGSFTWISTGSCP